jgi:hypothetical protein
MPKVNTPEISKGFWVTAGVLLALFVMGLLSMLAGKARRK